MARDAEPVALVPERLSKQDGPALTALLKTWAQAEGQNFDLALGDKALEALLALQTPIFHACLKSETELLAFISGFAIPVQTQTYFWISGLCTHPSVQGQGLAQILLQEARRWAVQLKAQKLAVAVRVANAQADGFYRRCGFAPLALGYWRQNVPISAASPLSLAGQPKPALTETFHDAETGCRFNVGFDFALGTWDAWGDQQPVASPQFPKSWNVSALSGLNKKTARPKDAQLLGLRLTA